MGPELPMKTVAKELITGDIQFRGALSCFEPARSAIEAADYDPILLRYNPDDTYGDGANFELACTKETADRFEFEAHEAVAMEAAAAEAAAAEAAAEAERNKKPPRARAGPQTIRPWVTDGSTEAEIDAMTIKPDKEPPVVITLSRPYSEFGRPCNFGDADALDLFDSSRCEVRPKKEQLEFEVMTHLDTGVQAVPTVGEMEVQATPGPPKPMVTQTEPRLMDPEEAKAHMVNGGELATFLLRIQDDMEHMLLENSVFNYYEDELELLGQFDDEDEAAEDGGTEEIKETMSFSSLTHSKGRKASCVDWKPSDKLALAVSCVEPHSFEERVEAGGQARPGSVLVWHFTDPINPQYVLEAPVDVHSFAFNPERSDIIAGGLADGRIVIWDTRDIGEEIMAYQIRRSKGGEGAGAVGPPVCRPKQLSEAAMSHVLPVTDVKWLGPVSVSRGGEVAKAESCDFFATTSADGRVLFWPTELTKNPKTKLMEWAPSHECKMTRGEVAGILQAISLDFIDLDAGKSTFWATGMAGEVAQCDFKMREDDETVPMDASRMVSHFHEGRSGAWRGRRSSRTWRCRWATGRSSCSRRDRGCPSSPRRRRTFTCPWVPSPRPGRASCTSPRAAARLTCGTSPPSPTSPCRRCGCAAGTSDVSGFGPDPRRRRSSSWRLATRRACCTSWSCPGPYVARLTVRRHRWRGSCVERRTA